MNISGLISSRLSHISAKIETLVIKYQRNYFAFVCLFALMGYMIALIFPLFAITGVIKIQQLMTSTDTDWQSITIWTALLLLSISLSLRIFQTKVSAPVGLRVSEEKLPEIFKLINNMHSHFKRPVIHRVIISTQYELNIIKTPKWPVPVWSENTLVIGLPVLICLSGKQFECMVARRIGQFSKQHNPVTNWLYQLRTIWTHYAEAFEKQNGIDSLLLKYSYAIYAYLYSALSFDIARKDELNADSYAMEMFNHEDVREMISIDTLYQYYIDNTFRPAIEKLVSEGKTTDIKPNRKLATIVQTSLKQQKKVALINKLFEPDFQCKRSMPSPLQRLENIAHDTPGLSQQSNPSAASLYLGASANTVIDLIDKLWIKNTRDAQQKPVRRLAVSPMFLITRRRRRLSS